MTETDHGNPEASLADAELLQLRTLDLLDFEAVRDRVAGYATFPPARRFALGLTPSYAPHEVAVLQRETAEGRALLERGMELNLPGSEDAAPFVQRAALESTLTGVELLSVAELLETLYRARNAFTRSREHAPLLGEIASGIPDLRDISREVSLAIGPRGEVMDSATPNLGPLRRESREAYQRVTQALDRVIQSSEAQQAIQDQVISVRSERLVLQVKAEMRHRVPGIVHDASNTGATLYVEPLATVNLGNTWRELVLEEDREVQRVLHRLSSMIGAVADDVVRGTEYTSRLDFIMARARFSAAVRGIPSQSATGAASEGVLRLVNARHPLLGREAVPVNIGIGPEWSTLVITGPNTGGKTVAMKTVGLLAQMHQSGLQIPADEGSHLPIFDGVYADVGDRQSIAESVSTFSSHVKNVIDILSVATPSSLVLLDELGTSTDPEEGSALAKAILDRLSSDEVPTVTTTHHRTVAAYAEAHPGMMNASVELHAETLEPTYRLTVGIPGRSYAMAVADRLGLPPDIMANAESLLEPHHRSLDGWLNELNQERGQLQEALDATEEANARAEAVRRDYEARKKELDSNRQAILDSVRSEIAAQYDDVRRKIRRIEAAVSWSPPPVASTPERGPEAPPTVEEIEEAVAELEEARQEIDAVKVEAAPEAPQAEDRPIEVGDLVDVRGLDLRGRVEALSSEDEEADVVIGNLRLKLAVDRLDLAPPQPDEPEADAQEAGREPKPGQGSRPLVDLVTSEPSRDLDLRGVRAEPAIFAVEEFLSQAVADGLTAVRIIHGHGTGVLRTIVRDLLQDHTLAKAFRPEVPERGGNGVTVVELV